VRTALHISAIVAGLAMIAALLWLLNRVLPDSIPTSARLIMLVLFVAFLWVHIADARVGIDFLGRVRKR
jgi:type IV secretory pathway TrbL component